MNHIKDFVANILSGNNVEAREMFNDLVSEIAMEKLGERKQEIAHNLFQTEEVESLEEAAKWRSTSVARKVTDPDSDDPESMSYHEYDNPRSTGMLTPTSKTPEKRGSLSARRPSQIATQGPRKGMITKRSAESLKDKIKASLRGEEVESLEEGPIGAALGGIGGTLVGGPVGGAIGAALGHKAGNVTSAAARRTGQAVGSAARATGRGLRKIGAVGTGALVGGALGGPVGAAIGGYAGHRMTRKEEVELTEDLDYKPGEKVRVPHKGRMFSGKVVSYSSAPSDDKNDPNAGIPYYIVDVGKNEHIKVLAHHVRRNLMKNEEVEIFEQAPIYDVIHPEHGVIGTHSADRGFVPSKPHLGFKPGQTIPDRTKIDRKSEVRSSPKNSRGMLTRGFLNKEEFDFEQLTEGRVKELEQHLKDHLGPHISAHNSGKLDRKSFNDRIAGVHKKIADTFDISHEHAKEFVNDYANKRLKTPKAVSEEIESIEEKAVSQAQQSLMGAAYAVKAKGAKPASPEISRLAASMTTKQLRDYAATKHAGLPKKVDQED